MNNIYKKNIIDSLHVLADYDHQKKTWFSSSWPWSSFAEDVCQLFDDTGLDRALKSNETIFGKVADKVLHELDDAVSEVNSKLPPQLLLNDPRVQLVREKAAEALRLITSNSSL